MPKTNNDMILVVDTNVFLASFSRRSPYHWFFQMFQRKEFNIAVSNEILSEYEEKFSQFYDAMTAKNFIEFILVSRNVTLTTPYYRWNLIEADPDDNKFVDCAIAANADYIVSNDRHFAVLESVPFPSMTVLTLQEFCDLK